MAIVRRFICEWKKNNIINTCAKHGYSARRLHAITLIRISRKFWTGHDKQLINIQNVGVTKKYFWKTKNKNKLKKNDIRKFLRDVLNENIIC